MVPDRSIKGRFVYSRPPLHRSVQGPCGRTLSFLYIPVQSHWVQWSSSSLWSSSLEEKVPNRSLRERR